MPSVSVMELINLDLNLYGYNPGYNVLSRLAVLRIIPYKCNGMIGKKAIYQSHYSSPCATNSLLLHDCSWCI